MIQTDDIRKRYLDFFAAREHKIVPSAPLVPPDDPTLLFTTAGMVQFKPYYSGDVEPPFPRAATVQKCLRAGGKGSDLENVGRTLRHHTFFEMLGNFSFGDYFKREAIEWAWEFCTGEQWLGLPPERIWPSVFGKKDDKGAWLEADEEAERFWNEHTGNVNPIVRLDEKENFWGPAGDTGACGPCSEIKFFTGSEEELARYRELARSGEEGMARLAHDSVELGDLFLEIWNLVFPQFNQQPDGSRPPLKYRGIDTGAGLERVTTAVQLMQSGGRVRSPYETNELFPFAQEVARVAGLPYPRLAGDAEAEERLRREGLEPAAVRLAMNACVDHARALTFTLAEGIVPSNEGRGYVMRRILRRAARFGRKIGIGDPFLWKLVDPVVETMGGIYPELKSHPEQIRKTIRLEEERFNRTLNLGSEMLDELLAKLGKGDTLPGEEAFRLYDTYGFPLDLTLEVAEERGVGVDRGGFERCLADSKQRARASWKGGGVDLGSLVKDLRGSGRECGFVGYDKLEERGRVVALARDGKRVDALEEGQSGIVVLDRTPFYGESGGQVGDRGEVVDAEGRTIFRVEDAQKTEDGWVLHFGEAQAAIAPGQEATARVDAGRRRATIKNHSATHLLQGALKRIVGRHVTQSGSLVDPHHLRFDFTNPEAIPDETLREIERTVNEQVQRNLPVETQVMSLEEAKATGAIAPFGEKYGATVRVVRMGDFSVEFCGGTHVNSTGEIGQFIITSESSVASGIRRIEAKTGEGAVETVARERGVLHELSRALAVAPEQLPERLAQMQKEIKALRRETEQAKTRQLTQSAGELEETRIGDVTACVAWIDGADLTALRSTLDNLKSKHKNANFLAVLGSGQDGKATLIVGATPDLAGTALEAGRVVREIAPLFDGRGGGKAQFAQAGGKDAAKLKSALQNGPIRDKLTAMV